MTDSPDAQKVQLSQIVGPLLQSSASEIRLWRYRLAESDWRAVSRGLVQTEMSWKQRISPRKDGDLLPSRQTSTTLLLHLLLVHRNSWTAFALYEISQAKASPWEKLVSS